MKLAIMQPYFFPYIGYWQLINAVDKFALFDDVNFIKRGYINRNKIYGQNNSVRINIRISNISQNKLISEHNLDSDSVWKKKLLLTIKHNYKKAKYFNSAFPLIEEIINNQEKNLSEFLFFQIKKISEYLDIQTKIVKTSELYGDTKTLKGQDRILEICKKENANIYINAPGGKSLYQKDVFNQHNITLKFIKPGNIHYKQFTSKHIPDLSVIDVMMFNNREELKKILNNYTLE